MGPNYGSKTVYFVANLFIEAAACHVLWLLTSDENKSKTKQLTKYQQIITDTLLYYAKLFNRYASYSAILMPKVDKILLKKVTDTVILVHHYLNQPNAAVQKNIQYQVQVSSSVILQLIRAFHGVIRGRKPLLKPL